MISLVGSLADNKAALGRRYAEWAVSAPTIESAVAAAAMAQDELGHVALDLSGAGEGWACEREDAGFDADQPLVLLDSELPDWTSRRCQPRRRRGADHVRGRAALTARSTPLAQRARKILQEEGSHRVHAEAWAKRIARAGGDDLQLLVRRIEEMWAQAARWPGPDSDPGYRDAIAQGMVRDGPLAIRDRVRDWLTALLEGEGAAVSLPEPDDWSEWDAQHRR